MKNLATYLSFGLFFLLFSCSEEDLNPTVTQFKEFDGIIENLEELKGFANGMYDRMTASTYYGRDYIIYGEVRSDNCFADGNSGRFVTVGRMKISPDGNYSTDTWFDIYKVIASANLIIGQNPDIISGNPNEIRHIIGQAHVVRALAHFDLLKLFGQQHTGGNKGVPYISGYVGSYEGVQIAPARGTIEENRDSIYTDIDRGISLMSEFFDPTSKQFITLNAANAIEARVALYFGEWEKAKKSALEVINSGSYEIIDASEFQNSWFTDAASNSIFELAFSKEDNNSSNSLSQIYRGSTYGDIEVLEDLVSVFDENDIRATPEMIGAEIIQEQEKLRNLGKYPSSDNSDNISLIRFEEMILTLAEAKIELGENDALQYLNMIPEKRNARLYTNATKENVLKERRREFCFEGFRFDDLARTGSDIPLVDPLKQTHGGPEYNSYNFAFPIPTAELNANPNMEQNPGY